jgi:hypothetical protein
MSDEAKRKPGRPKKPEDEKARTKLWVYLTRKEKEQLDARLRAANLSASRYVRNLLWQDGVFSDEPE